jgi:hypothetical protein
MSRHPGNRITSRVTMKRIVLSALVLCGSMQGQIAAAGGSDWPARMEGLNAEQTKAVEEYIQENERPVGEMTIVADRKRIALRSSEALRTLFPKYRFVAIPWKYAVSPGATGKYSVPISPLFQTLALDRNGRNCTPKPIANQAEYADFLRVEQIKITDEVSAARVMSAFGDIYGIGVSSTNLRHGQSEWWLGYRESPFRAISSYEDVREASYYLISIDSNGFVVGGRSVNEVLERRKINLDAPRL